MTDRQPVKRIAILGHVGTKNLGDETIFAAVIQNIRSRYSDAEICAFTSRPNDTQSRHKIPAFPLRRLPNDNYLTQQHGQDLISIRADQNLDSLYEKTKTWLKRMPRLFLFLKRINACLRFFPDVLRELRFLVGCMRNLAGTDLLLVAGSGQLTDLWGGAWAYPYTILKWVLMARLTRAKVAFMSVGAGPINSPLSRVLFKCALSLADYRSFRDESSRRLIKDIGIRGENHVFPDLAYSLKMPNIPCISSARLPAPPSVGLNPVPCFNPRFWPEANRVLYESYVQALASFGLWLLQTNHRLSFIPTQLVMDPPVIEGIKRTISNSESSYEDLPNDEPLLSLEDLMRQISNMNVVVASRFHGVLISYLLNKPVLGISYHKKTNDLMAQMGQSEYIVDINCVDMHSLIERFKMLESKSEIIRRQIKDRVSEHRQALDVQYDRVFRLIEAKELEV